jgi:dienelactone hydrolase
MRHLRLVLLILGAAVLAAPVSAEVKTRVVDYTVGGVALQGLVAWDDAVSGKRPGVLVVHEWWGHNEHARTAARRLAELAPVKPGVVKAEVLVFTGAADPMVPADQVSTFKKEMEAAGAKLDIVSYPNAKHGFTNPDAGTFGMDALGYDAAADKASWAEMLKAFKRVFSLR